MSERRSAESEALVLATPLRPYAPGTPLIAVSESAWDDARDAETRVTELEDALANASAHARRLENGVIEARALHAGRHPCPTGDGREWFMWDAKETCPTARALPDLTTEQAPSTRPDGEACDD